jgi:ABC-type protease/lipase transport system fused ATPase/permease subunit
MTFFGMALLTAIGTVVLAAFAVVTAVYARKAFREQSREVAAIEQQVMDEQEITRQQAELLKVQTGQLELQRQQLEDQRAASAKAGKLAGLSACQVL